MYDHLIQGFELFMGRSWKVVMWSRDGRRITRSASTYISSVSISRMFKGMGNLRCVSELTTIWLASIGGTRLDVLLKADQGPLFPSFGPPHSRLDV
jgi:hypothetical protein